MVQVPVSKEAPIQQETPKLIVTHVVVDAIERTKYILCIYYTYN